MDFKIELDNMFDDLFDNKTEKQFEIIKLKEDGFDHNTKSIIDLYYSRLKELFDACSEYHGRFFLCGGWLRYFLNYYIKPNESSGFFSGLPARKPHRIIHANDVDFYCKDQETFDGIKKIFRYKMLFTRKFETQNAITYKKWSTLQPIQLIKPMVRDKIVTMGSLSEILRNFDFTVIRVGMDHDLFEQKKVLIDVDFERDELNHYIVIKNIHCPISSLQRVIKYCKKGYTIKEQELIKLFDDWDSRDAKYKKDLKVFFQNIKQLSATQIQNTYARMTIMIMD